MPRVAPALSLAALALFGSFLAGCGGSSSSANGCGTHQYTYVGGGLTVIGGAPWYGGDSSGGWYDPGDDGTDYGDESASAGGSGGGSSGDDGSGDTYGDGSGNDGSGDDGSYDDGSGDDGSGSSDDGSGDDGSGDDGSGDDGTASKKHLHTSSVQLHTQSGASHANACYAYSCDLLCAVGSPATAEREARGYSAISANDACVTAAHGVETWAHDSLGSNVSACKVATGDQPGPSTAANASRSPATPAVSGGSSSSSGTTRSAPYTGRTIR